MTNSDPSPLGNCTQKCLPVKNGTGSSFCTAEMFILVFDQSSIHCALCMYACVSVSLSEWEGLTEKRWWVRTPRGPAKERTALHWGRLLMNARRETIVGFAVFFRRLKMFWMYKNKWKLSLRPCHRVCVYRRAAQWRIFVFWYFCL